MRSRRMCGRRRVPPIWRTGLAEAVLVATKRTTPHAGSRPAAPVRHVILNRRPDTVAEAVETARAVTRATEPGYLRLGEQRIGWSAPGTIGEAAGDTRAA